MPESNEGLSSGQQAKKSFDAAKEAGGDFTLERIMVDATKKEVGTGRVPPDAKEGLVYELDSHSTVQRGQTSQQNPVYPPSLRTTTQNPNPAPLSSLTLEDISYTNRAIVCHFGTQFFMLQYLTHTSIQFYPRAVWERSIRKVSKDVRKFSIAVAFVFRDHVLAFPSIDMVFQPTWASSLSDFSIPPNIFTAPNDFLALVAPWIEHIIEKPVHSRACDTIRTANTIFYGLGVYTVMELFFAAGLSPFLTLHEVFSNPSRAARFLVAFYSHIARAERDLWQTVVQPAIHNGILGPTTAQRLRYEKWLYVWAKDKTSVPPRMACLVDAFHAKIDELGAQDTAWGRETEDQLFDVFEPTFLALGLQSDMNLGHLIFGADDWVRLGGKQSPHDDPITELYRKHGLLGSSTHLNFDPSGPLLLPVDLVRGRNSSYCRTYAFHNPKQMWSITRDFPPNSYSRLGCKNPAAAKSVEGEERTSLLFKTIVTSTRGVAIGPLEYCGAGHIVRIGQTEYVAVCKGDPAIPQYHEERAFRGLERKSSHLEAGGKRKRARSDRENNELTRKLGKIDVGYQRSAAIEGVDEGEAEPTKPKKRRLSADQRLALATMN
ncbi:hypothetical protein C8R46DRAFT_970612 [Mycena filopes]|nr:hypothetical protein C8R46DRAFT_1363758 [Mycena filopes]KAJ7132626.1 hypothetical protein C8R46DRAFT_970612 [Mycena filopes]